MRHPIHTRHDSFASALLQPRSVALVGASDDPGKTAGRPQMFLRRSGFKGKVYPINARRATVQEAQAWPGVHRRGLPRSYCGIPSSGGGQQHKQSEASASL